MVANFLADSVVNNTSIYCCYTPTNIILLNIFAWSSYQTATACDHDLWVVYTLFWLQMHESFILHRSAITSADHIAYEESGIFKVAESSQRVLQGRYCVSIVLYMYISFPDQIYSARFQSSPAFYLNSLMMTFIVGFGIFSTIIRVHVNTKRKIHCRIPTYHVSRRFVFASASFTPLASILLECQREKSRWFCFKVTKHIKYIVLFSFIHINTLT